MWRINDRYGFDFINSNFIEFEIILKCLKYFQAKVHLKGANIIKSIQACMSRLTVKEDRSGKIYPEIRSNLENLIVNIQ